MPVKGLLDDRISPSGGERSSGGGLRAMFSRKGSSSGRRRHSEAGAEEELTADAEAQLEVKRTPSMLKRTASALKGLLAGGAVKG